MKNVSEMILGSVTGLFCLALAGSAAHAADANKVCAIVDPSKSARVVCVDASATASSKLVVLPRQCRVALDCIVEEPDTDPSPEPSPEPTPVPIL